MQYTQLFHSIWKNDSPTTLVTRVGKRRSLRMFALSTPVQCSFYHFPKLNGNNSYFVLKSWFQVLTLFPTQLVQGRNSAVNRYTLEVRKNALKNLLPARGATSEISSPAVYRWTISLTRGWNQGVNFPVLQEFSIFYPHALALWTSKRPEHNSIKLKLLAVWEEFNPLYLVYKGI